VGLFEEEEEGTGIASNIVKVEGGDLATPGEHLRSVTVTRGHPGTVMIPHYQVNKTKQSNTLTKKDISAGHVHIYIYATLLLHTTCVRSCCTWRASCVTA